MRHSRDRNHTVAIRCTLTVAMLAAFLVCSPPARAGIDVRIDISSAPPAPHLIFHERPHARYFPGESMYVVDDPDVGDYDVFRQGGYYWVFSDGYWYRARDWRGPFLVIRPNYVPTAFYRMPPARWKHRPNGPPHMGMPPGHMRQRENVPPPSRRQEAIAPHRDSRPSEHGKQRNAPPGQQKKGPKGGDKSNDKGNDKDNDKGGHEHQ
jgi:hypothetical protein